MHAAGLEARRPVRPGSRARVPHHDAVRGGSAMGGGAYSVAQAQNGVVMRDPSPRPRLHRASSLGPLRNDQASMPGVVSSTTRPSNRWIERSACRA